MNAASPFQRPILCKPNKYYDGKKGGYPEIDPSEMPTDVRQLSPKLSIFYGRTAARQKGAVLTMECEWNARPAFIAGSRSRHENIARPNGDYGAASLRDRCRDGRCHGSDFRCRPARVPGASAPAGAGEQMAQQKTVDDDQKIGPNPVLGYGGRSRRWSVRRLQRRAADVWQQKRRLKLRCGRRPKLRPSNG